MCRACLMYIIRWRQLPYGRELELNLSTIKKGLPGFPGVQRRLEIKGKVADITVVDDYGHHPTEIKETLAAARQVWKGRLIVVFQPHRFTRTKALFDEFTTAFTDADMLILNDIYPASEEPISGINSAASMFGDQKNGPSIRRIYSEGERNNRISFKHGKTERYSYYIRCR